MAKYNPTVEKLESEKRPQNNWLRPGCQKKDNIRNCRVQTESKGRCTPSIEPEIKNSGDWKVESEPLETNSGPDPVLKRGGTANEAPSDPDTWAIRCLGGI